MELTEALARRKMTRNFSGRPLDPGVLDRLLAQALRAPSAGNTQGRELVVLEGADETSLYWDATTDRAWRASSPVRRACPGSCGGAPLRRPRRLRGPLSRAGQATPHRRAGGRMGGALLVGRHCLCRHGPPSRCSRHRIGSGLPREFPVAKRSCTPRSGSPTGSNGSERCCSARQPSRIRRRPRRRGPAATSRSASTAATGKRPPVERSEAERCGGGYSGANCVTRTARSKGR